MKKGPLNNFSKFTEDEEKYNKIGFEKKLELDFTKAIKETHE